MKPKCEHTREQVYAYLDGEMRYFRRVRIWWHLRRCPPCGDGFHFERRFLDKVRDDCIEEVPEELVDRLRAFLSQHASEPPGMLPASEE
jgi:mycothiol system anti-sigma-R factor